MRPALRFVKTTLVGGLVIVLPIWVAALLLIKAIKGVLGVLRPIATLLPQNIVHENVVAVALLLIICFSAGLLMRAALTRRMVGWFETKFLEYIPGYSLLRSITQRLTGQAEDQSFQAALVVIEDALVPAFIVECHADGQCTVFVPASPTPATGAIYILPEERVHRLNVPLHRAFSCVSNWGEGSGELLAAMRPK